MQTTLPALDTPLYARLRHLTVDVLELDPDVVVPAARFAEDLGADSLDLVELVEAIEAEFGIRIDDEELAEVTTVAEAYSLVSGKVA
jgi:acyl carrier protein